MNRTVVTTGLAILLMASLAGPALAQMDPPLAASARDATPRDDLVAVSEQPWSYLAIAPDGRSLEVYWQDGLPECRGLDRVEATRDRGILDVRVFTGDVVDNKGCDALLVLWVTTVEFEEPLALGGRGAIDAAWAAWQDEVRAIRLAAVHELEEALPGTVRFVTDEAGREDFRLTAEGRADALAAFGDPETTRDDLVDYLLAREQIVPTYPPDPGEEETTGQ
jgi:hypothetical protein